jgi:hypothetical protein
MTSQNRAEKPDKATIIPRDDAAPKAAEPSESRRELTDEEFSAVVGGLNPQPLPPITDPHDHT